MCERILTLPARMLKPDVVHIHAVGPNLFTLLARLLGLKVVMTHHGPDYERKKWGQFAKLILQMGERFGCMFANQVIVIAQNIADSVKEKYGRDSVVIPNGVDIPEPAVTDGVLKRYGLEKKKYLLAVARFVPEKGLHDLINAFSALDNCGWKLAIAGDADHEDEYSRGLKKHAAANANVVLTGFIKGTPLHELYTHAGLFVLPSYYEGLPIVLLEALSYGLPCLVSDIPANRNVPLPEDCFFRPGEVTTLTRKLANSIQNHAAATHTDQIAMIRENYNWDTIAVETERVLAGVGGEKVAARG